MTNISRQDIVVGFDGHYIETILFQNDDVKLVVQVNLLHDVMKYRLYTADYEHRQYKKLDQALEEMNKYLK